MLDHRAVGAYTVQHGGAVPCVSMVSMAAMFVWQDRDARSNVGVCRFPADTGFLSEERRRDGTWAAGGIVTCWREAQGLLLRMRLQETPPNPMRSEAKISHNRQGGRLKRRAGGWSGPGEGLLADTEGGWSV